MVPGCPDREGYQRRQAGAGHIHDHILDAARPGAIKILGSLLNRGKEQTKTQRPDASVPRPIVRMPAKSPKPEKVRETVCQEVTGFPHLGH
jgi:hypothetical protein